MKKKEKQYKKVYDVVKWWQNDMAFKAPEQLTEVYYETMAEDIASVATGRPRVLLRRLDL